MAFAIGHLSLAICFAETFSIENGGTIEGRLLKPGERIRQIETAGGIILSLDARRIRETPKNDNENLAHYMRTVPFMSDTVETHWEIAKWCREYSLKEQEQEHLKRILELDPDNDDARKQLGYFREAKMGQWTTTEEVQSAKGYVPYKGSWRMPQEIWIYEQIAKNKEVHNDWKQDLKQVRESLNNPMIRKKLEEIRDPAAIEPLCELLKKENVPQARMILIRALASIGGSAAVRIIADYVMHDPNEDVRGTCLDQIKRHPEMIPQAGAYFSTFLLNPNPNVINQAADAIRTIGDTGSVGNLIGALVSQHKETIVVGSARSNVGFNNSGGTGLTQGQSTQDVVKSNKNSEVLAALRQLTGVDFGYDQAAWTRWYKEKRQIGDFDARRG